MRHRLLVVLLVAVVSQVLGADPSLAGPKKKKKKAPPAEPAAVAEVAAPESPPTPSPAPPVPATAGETTAAAPVVSTSPNTGASHLPPPFSAGATTLSAGLQIGSNDLDFGIGIRGGYTLPQGIYIGGIADYWFGKSETQSVPGTTFQVSASAHAWDLFATGGYDFGITPAIVLRPYAGLGLIYSWGHACFPDPLSGNQTCADASDSSAAGLLGGQGLMSFGRFNLGGDLRLMIADETAAILTVQAGTIF